jgi:hypothetical protein
MPIGTKSLLNRAPWLPLAFASDPLRSIVPIITISSIQSAMSKREHLCFEPWRPDRPALRLLNWNRRTSARLFWFFRSLDLLVIDFMKSTTAHSVVTNIVTIPHWMFKTINPLPSPITLTKSWNDEQGCPTIFLMPSVLQAPRGRPVVPAPYAKARTRENLLVPSKRLELSRAKSEGQSKPNCEVRTLIDVTRRGCCEAVGRSCRGEVQAVFKAKIANSHP